MEVKANAKKFLQILSDPGLTPFHIHPPPLLFELIPLYSMCLLPSPLVRRVSSLPTLRDRAIQPEQYGTASCSRCSSAPLRSPMSPQLCLSGTQCVSARGKRRGRGSTAGRLNKVWQGQSWGTWYAPSSQLLLFHPHPPVSSFPHYLLLFHSLILCLSATLLHISFSPGHPCAHHIFYFSKCFCFHLLYFPVHPLSVTSLFLDTLGSV